MSALVHAEGLEKSYVDGPTVVGVLAGADVVVGEGERLAIVGQSGVGKSTLLHILGTLDRPNAGRLTIAGVDVLALDDGRLALFRNATIGFVFQFHQLLGDFTAEENVALALMMRGESARTARRRAGEALERVGLAARVAHRPGEMSGGEQQRVAIARALVGRPRLVLADEPTGNLDPATGARVQDLLLDVNRETGAALIVVTHNERLADAMGRRLEMTGGRLREWRAGARRESVGGGAP